MAYIPGRVPETVVTERLMLGVPLCGDGKAVHEAMVEKVSSCQSPLIGIKHHVIPLVLCTGEGITDHDQVRDVSIDAV